MRLRRRPTYDDERWYPRNGVIAWLAEARNLPITLLLGYSALLALFLNPWPAIILVGAVAAVATVACRGSYGWRLDDVGLHELRVAVPSRIYRWSELHDAAFTPRELVVTTAKGILRLPLKVRGTRHLGERLKNAIRPEEMEAAEMVSPEVIANWLGIGADDELFCGVHPAVRLLLSGSLAIEAIAAVALPFIQPWEERAAWIWLGLMLAAASRQVWRAYKLPIATVHGLRVNRRELVPWSEVTGVKDNVVIPQWVVLTERRPVSIHGRNGERVARMIEKLVEARRRGAVLPRMTDIPDHALSRAESAEVSAERGISAAEDG